VFSMSLVGGWHLGLSGDLELLECRKGRRKCRIAPNAAKPWFCAPLARVLILGRNSMAVLVFRDVEEHEPCPQLHLQQKNQ